MGDELKAAFAALEARTATWRGEEEVRQAWVIALNAALGVHLDAERGKRDLSYNNVIIEFKAPGLFNGTASSPKFKEALDERLKKYIPRAAAKDGRPEEDYIGFAIDGPHIAQAGMAGGVIEHGPLMPFSIHSFEMVANAIRANYRRAITAENLADDFGHRSAIGRATMQTLANALARALRPGGSTKIAMLFEEWETLYGQAASLSAQQKKSINASLGFTFGRPPGRALAAKLFVAHTFHSLLIKLIAAEIVAAHGLAASRSLIAELIALDHPGLIAGMARHIERGAFFEAVGLSGFVEEAIFSWYVDAAAAHPDDRTAICEALYALIAKLAVYRFDRLDMNGRSRDVLRDFYQDLVPDELRKSLGEFYTPDWLVEHTLDKTGCGEDEWLDVRVLDPTCGSGSFLLESIARKRAAARRAGLSPGETARRIVDSVWGFDLNPLAVQSARTNFLMAIADLLRDAKGMRIEIPVLLADAVYSPAPDPEGDAETVRYSIGSKAANLEIELPAALARDRALLDAVFAEMGSQVDGDTPADKAEYPKAERALVDSGVLSEEQAAAWRGSLKRTYDQVLGLHRKQWNGIWFRIVRNFFWSATAGRFDLIAGNPPWVRWSNLPEAYRNRAKPTCEQYDIFAKTKFHGGNELDISAMITVTTADKWLKTGGRLAFVITQTVFQTPSSQGFRRFRISRNGTERLVPLSVDDLKDLKPFANAANKTAVALFEKRQDAEAQYPVAYTLWRGTPKLDADGAFKWGRNGQLQRSKTIDPGLPLAEVLGRIERVAMEATPVSGTDDGAPWAVMRPGRFPEVAALFGRSSWVNGRKGITTDLNGVYFVTVAEWNAVTRQVRVRTRPDEGKTDIGVAKQFWIDAELLYPLAKGAGDFDACHFRPAEEVFAIVPNRGIDNAALAASRAVVKGPGRRHNKTFFDAFEPQLRNRATYKQRLTKGPFYSIYNVGDYTFAPYKVIWPEMTNGFRAAVVASGVVPGIGLRPYVPDHKIFFVDFADKEPANFLCGLMNSTIFREAVESHIVPTQMGDVFKHLDLPAYDATRSMHRELSQLVEDAHREADEAKRRLDVSASIALADRILADEIRRRRALTQATRETADSVAPAEG